MDTDSGSGPRDHFGFVSTPTSSFAQYVSAVAPEMLPGRQSLPPNSDTSSIPHGTTIVATTYADGVVMAGDRRVTQGNLIAIRDVEKVFPADEYTAIGFAGAAGFGAELVRLYQVELEHYEKLEGASLSVDGKANRLSMLIRNHLGLAMQGLAVVPLLAAYDPDQDRGRIFSYEVTGGRYEERGFEGVGSGSLFAKGSLKKLYRPDASREHAVLACLQALYDAAEEDSATAGPDALRKIYPLVVDVNDTGYHQLAQEELGRLVEDVLAGRANRPDGPIAPVAQDDSSEGSAQA